MYKVTLMLAASLSFSSRSTCIRIAFVSCVYARHRQRDGTGREREGVRQHMCVIWHTERRDLFKLVRDISFQSLYLRL